MPDKPRKEIIDPSVTGTYHAMARCVRRGFFLGFDPITQKNYAHRRSWIRKRVKYLARYFAVELLFFGFLSNHYHIVLRNLPNLVEGWDDEEVIRRACKIFPWKFKRLGVKVPGKPTQEQLQKLVADKKLVKQMRKRLADPSWFMKQLNQHIATRANKEDDCTGHFFEQRFKAVAITDLFALLIVGLYIDLNEIMAGVAESVDDSSETSLHARLLARRMREQGSWLALRVDGFLTPVFVREETDGYPSAGQFGAYRASQKPLLDMNLDQYVEAFQLVLDHYRSLPPCQGKKPPLPIEEIEDFLRAKGVLPHITGDIGK